MINITFECCGCSACVQKCPKKCITMQEDNEGFSYPVFDINKCINCGLCEKVCPVLNKKVASIPRKVYAAKNGEYVRLQSSSGGIFAILAENIIDQGGVVFGAKYNSKWEVVHDYTTTKEGIQDFQMSKYVQSNIGNAYSDVENFLKKNVLVLFTGTPCQIAGLKNYLNSNYDSLICVDLICHGVPSPGVFRWYINEELYRFVHNSKKIKAFTKTPLSNIPSIDTVASDCGLKVDKICFRDKSRGWKNFSFVLDSSSKSQKKRFFISQPLNKNPFLRGFLEDLYLRPSCHACPSKELSSGSDITLGDYWAIDKLIPNYDDDKGVSAILINTEKGEQIVDNCQIDVLETKYEDICRLNPALVKSSILTEKRARFFQNDAKPFKKKIKLICSVPISKKVKCLLYKCVSKLIK